jgi:hypothetical protein
MSKEISMGTLSGAAAVLLVVSCLLALRATAFPIRNSIDDFIDDLNRQGRWATAGALAALGVGIIEVVKLF